VAIRFDNRLVQYDFSELDEVSLAYAVVPVQLKMEKAFSQ